MSRARVTGRTVELLITAQSLPVPISLGEIDSFSAKSQTTIIKSRPIGFINDRATVVNGGWDLSFETGKVDWALCHYYWLQEQKLRSGKLPPSLIITETITHYDDAREQYLYKNVVLFGLELARGIDELPEKFDGFATNRTLGPVDTTIVADPLGNAAREAIMRINSSVLGDIVSNFDRPF